MAQVHKMQDGAETENGASEFGGAGPAFGAIDRRPPPNRSGYAGPDRRAEAEELSGFDLARAFNVLWRGKWTIIAATLLLTGAAYVLTSQQTPVFEATASILIEGEQANVIGFQDVVAGIDTSSAGLENQAEIIRSDQLADRVIEKLRLDRDPEFNRSLAGGGEGVVDRVRRVIWPAADGPASSGPADDGPPVFLDGAFEEQRHASAVRRAFKRRLSVRRRPRSQVMIVAFASTDRRKAALIANTVADQYIVDQLEAKFAGAQRATIWLNDRLAELKSNVQVAEKAVVDFRADLAAQSGQSIEMTDQQLAQLTASLAQARAATAEAEARYDQVRRLAASGADLAAASDVGGARAIESLRAKLTDLRRSEAELATRYGPKHPRMINLRAEIDDLLGSIASETTKTVATLENEVQIARAREESLRQSVVELQDRSLGQGRAAVRLRELEREAEASRLIYATFLTRFKETSEQAELQESEARVIAKADPPGAPVTPRVGQTVAFGGLLGAGLGLAFVLILEQLNNTFRTRADFEARTGLPLLGASPRLSAPQSRPEILAYLEERPNSALSEAVRNLRTSLLLSNIDRPPKTFLITSSVPSEGKSTLALLLASTSARMGRRTILVDCDLRRPTVSESFPVQDGKDLVAVVTGQAPLREAIAGDYERDKLCALPCLVSEGNPADILSSQRFRKLIASLSENFDMVVIDSPPVMPVTDARILSTIADATVLAVRWDDTPADVALDSIKQLHSVEAHLVGAAFTLVDEKRAATYNYGYRGRYGKYYSAASDAYYVN